MRPLLLIAGLLPFAVFSQEASTPAKTGWVLMGDYQGHGAADVSHADGLSGTFQRTRSGFEAIHEGADHALDIEYYNYTHKFTGAIAGNPDRVYGDTSDFIVSGFTQWQARSGHGHYQFIGALEAAPETSDTSGLGLGDAVRWGFGGAYRWTPAATFDVALGVMLQDRYEMSILPIPYVRAKWTPDASVSIEFRITGLQNGFYARWFATADKATSIDFSCAYETLTFRLTDGSYGHRAVSIGEVPLRVGVTQFLESSGTWFIRGAFEWVAFHRETFRHDGNTVNVFQAPDAPGWTMRVGARF